MTDEQLSALLRLKRYEQPPAAYFEGLLRDVHRRQRADLLQLPLWKIAVERMQTFFGEHSMGHLSYAGALASVLVLGVTVIGLVTPGGTVERVAVQTPAVAQKPLVVPGPALSGRLVSLQPTKVPSLERPPLQTSRPGFESLGSQPRYIIDARPASYEKSSSINF